MSNKPFLVGRTCTRKKGNAAEQGSCPLAAYRDLPAYVLLGDPGAGKTMAFESEAQESGGEYIRARDFAVFEPGAESQGKTLFIDALDEMRADGGDGRKPLDPIRAHLERLGRPRFRLSCREADWLGASDSEALKCVSPDGKVVALHLDPLSDKNIVDILRHKTSVPDPIEFMRKAQDCRLEELLRNPQTLKLLVEAVSGNQWPESRTEIYEMACRQLVREKNPEHRQAMREKALSGEALLDAAGYLCAIQLLSGIAGFAMDEEKTDKQYFHWREPGERNLPLLAALKTNLFKEDGEERRIPVHRSVAEYLGARHLAGLVEQRGLPFARVLSLMTGEDGGIVADLRGLAAWLSVHCLSGRHPLIERDPLGVVLYGDVRDFPTADKRLVLAAFKSEARRYPWFRSEDWSSSPFGALGTLDMVPAFREILALPSREEADQTLLECVLDAIRHGERMAGLADLLESVVRDPGFWPVIRIDAVQALLHVIPDDHSRLARIAEDIRAGVVEDKDDEILGTVLDKLYPNVISPAQVFDYLHTPKQSNLIGVYFMFWTHLLPETSAENDLPLLLDKLAQMQPVPQIALREHQLNRMIGVLLIRGLKAYGDIVTDERLYLWLGVGLDEYDEMLLDKEHVESIAEWFAARPGRYKALLEYGASLCSSQENVWSCLNHCEMRLYGSTPPTDIGIWYLEKAAAEQQEELAQYYFIQAVHLLIRQGGQRYLTLPALEFLESWEQLYPAFHAWLAPFISCPVGDWQQEHAIKNRERETERQKQKDEWVSYYHKHIAAIRDGSAFPKIYYDLARAYNGRLYPSAGSTPRERLENFLDGDQELVNAVYAGFRHVLERDDLPTIREILDLSLKGQMHYICHACLVGMEELYRLDPTDAMRLSEDVLSRLLAFHFTNGVGNNPPWFVVLIKERPALVAETLIAYALPKLRAGEEHVAGLNSLAYDDAYAEAARIALPALLEGFPVRARKLQLSNALDPLIKGALRYMDDKALAVLIAGKLALKSMDAAQRVYWLGCGLLVAPDTYEPKLLRYVGASAVRRGYLASLLYGRGKGCLPDRVSLSEITLAHLVELLAPDCSPERPAGPYWVSPAMNTADMVHSFINALGGNPSETASRELERLLALPRLDPWRNHLQGALHTQRIARRKASFRSLSVEEIGCALANLQPAGAADLAALTFDHLRDIARKIRDGSTNDYRQYWSYGEGNKILDKPKPENDCRDALLSDLNERLGKLGIDAQREGNYADEKRADIRVSFGGADGFNVPIEIKKDNHPDLWRAVHEQLIAKYVRDPGADGQGIYLVFWFGGKGLPPPPDGGKKPRSPQELEERLRQTLSTYESHRILVCVIDCALPI